MLSNEINTVINNNIINKIQVDKKSSISIKQINLINCFIINSKGKIIISRQFVEIPKRILFELTFLFERNLNLEGNKAKNTFDMKEQFLIEQQKINLKFTYQQIHIDNLYLVLTTNSNFNIFETLEIIKTIHRRISEICKFNSETHEELIEEALRSNAFEIILSIDDIVNNSFGVLEKNLSALRLNSKMESKDADDFLKEKEIKEKKTREDLVRGIEEIDKLKKENKYINNSVSSEMFENKYETVQETIEDILNPQIQRSAQNSLNLKDRLIQKLIEHREEVYERDIFSMACENMIKTMIMSEITRSYAERQFSDDDDEYEDANGPILMPLQIIFDSSDWDDNL